MIRTFFGSALVFAIAVTGCSGRLPTGVGGAASDDQASSDGTGSGAGDPGAAASASADGVLANDAAGGGFPTDTDASVVFPDDAGFYDPDASAIIADDAGLYDSDAGFFPPDGGPRDGGPRDGGPRDGGPRDGGPRPRDAGFGPDAAL